MTWYLLACPHCGGDLHSDQFEAGHLSCFLCARSFTLDIGTVVPVAPHVDPSRTNRPRPPIPEGSCLHGHPYTAETVGWFRDYSREYGGYYRCRICRKDQERAADERRRRGKQAADKRPESPQDVAESEPVEVTG